MTSNSFITIENLIQWGHASSSIPKSKQKQRVKRIWMDSRSIEEGDVFIAIKTEKNDGHQYVDAAFSAGACAAIVSTEYAATCQQKHSKSLIIVPDTLKALQKMATNRLKQLDIYRIGVTGSNGKTTTRSYISAILKSKFIVGETKGNFNNHLGVPLSILGLNGTEHVAIFELGANHLHEISTLSRIVCPDAAVITNIGYAHVGLFGSLKKTLAAKFEIVEGMNPKKSILFLNGDDHRLVQRAALEKRKIVFFGFSRRCDIRASNPILNCNSRLFFKVNGQEYEISSPGRHFIYCALPAIGLGQQLGLSYEDIRRSVASVLPDSLRGAQVNYRGATFIVDCYNANPTSMKIALKYLADVAGKQPRVAIVGDMLELGVYAKRLHSALGRYIVDSGVERVLAVGEYSQVVAEAAASRGLPRSNIFTADSSEQAAEIALKIVKPGDMVLLKGSRGVRLETIKEVFASTEKVTH